MAARSNASVGPPKCPCHLCKDTRLFGCALPSTSLPQFNGMAICAHTITRLTPPNIFCPYLEMWRSQAVYCCCTNHMNILDCEVNHDLKPECQCFRCCKICALGQSQVLARECGCFCHLKDRLYVPCKHYRGKCRSLQ